MEDVDIVHAVSGGSIDGAYLVARRFCLPLISQFIGSDVNLDLINHLSRRFFRLGLEYSRYLCFNSRSLKDVFFSSVNIKHESRVLYRGINLEEFNFYFDKLDSVNLLFLGGFPNNGNLKGGITLLEALVSLSKYDLPVNIRVMIGGPNAEDFKYIANNIKNPQITIELIGSVSRDAVKLKLRESHIVLIPSLSEGLPNVLYEAMATGNMVIATTVGGIPEVLVPEITGFLIAPGDSDALTDSILRCISDPKLIEECAINARKRVKNFADCQFLDGYLALYRKMM